MTREHGFGSPVWMAKAIVAYCPEGLLRDAVAYLIDGYGNQEIKTAFDAIDRLVQVAAIGMYMPANEEDEDIFSSFRIDEDGTISEDLSEDEEAEITDFREWLEKNLSDFDENEDDDD